MQERLPCNSDRSIHTEKKEKEKRREKEREECSQECKINKSPRLENGKL
jgi:hypothetical protein